MLKTASCWCLSLLVLAGCASGPRPNTGRAPDWRDTPPVSLVAPSTPLAPPASAPPDGRPPMVQRSTTNSANDLSRKPADRPDSALVDAGAKWIPLQRWCRTTGTASLSQLTSSGSQAFALRSGQGSLLLHPGTRLAQWEGVEVRLGFPPQLIDDQPYLHALDVDKTVLPLLNGGAGRTFSGPLVLDPGHGGEDAGAISAIGGQNEKDLTLDWALRLKRALKAKGFDVLLTRSNDAGVALSNRVALAVAARARAFVSLHFNSVAPDQNEAGLETYCLTPAGMPSTLTRGYADDPAQAYPNNAYDAQNLELAVQIHRALLQVNGRQDRGVRRTRFPAVLRGQKCPAVLVEGGYLSNPTEARLIADPGYRQKMADAVARALESCLGSKIQ